MHSSLISFEFKKCVPLFILLFRYIFWVCTLYAVHLHGVATFQQYLIVNFKAMPSCKRKKTSYYKGKNSNCTFSFKIYCRNAIWHINRNVEMRITELSCQKISDSSEFSMEINSMTRRTNSHLRLIQIPRLTGASMKYS